MSNPRAGKILVKHDGVSFYMTIEPAFNNNEEGREADSKPFEEIVKSLSCVFR